MKYREFARAMEELAPAAYAEPWDNPGLLAGRYDKEINTIFVALDATDEIIEQAVAAGADLLLTHHPLLFSAVKRVNDGDFIGRRMLRMIQADMNYYASHTNFDIAVMADQAAGMLELRNCQVLEVTGTAAGEPDNKIGIGKTGDLDRPIKLAEYAEVVKKQLELPAVTVYGDSETVIKKVSISPGSGKSMYSYAIEQQADVLVTGDITHHEGIDAVSNGICIIDAGHYGTEYLFVSYMQNWLSKLDASVKIVTENKKVPFYVI